MRIYISGPVSPIPHEIRAKFKRAEDELRAAGHDPVNPFASGDPVDQEGWVDKQTEDLTVLCGLKKNPPVDAILMLEGWEDSLRCSIENKIAKILEMPIFFSVDKIPPLSTLTGEVASKARAVLEDVIRRETLRVTRGKTDVRFAIPLTEVSVICDVFDYHAERWVRERDGSVVIAAIEVAENGDTLFVCEDECTSFSVEEITVDDLDILHQTIKTAPTIENTNS